MQATIPEKADKKIQPTYQERKGQCNYAHEVKKDEAQHRECYVVEHHTTADF